MAKIIVTATLVYEEEIDETNLAEAGYDGATTLDEAIALEKTWLAEDGDYLFQAISAIPTTVTIRIDKAGS